MLGNVICSSQALSDFYYMTNLWACATCRGHTVKMAHGLGHASTSRRIMDLRQFVQLRRMNYVLRATMGNVRTWWFLRTKGFHFDEEYFLVVVDTNNPGVAISS